MKNLDGIVSLFIFSIEIVLFINVLLFSKNRLKTLTSLIILLLALYQFTEFLICNLGLKDKYFIYLAFFSITLLPPTGLKLSLKLNDLKFPWLIYYAPAIFFNIYFFFEMEKLEVAKCTVLYAIYNYPLGVLYGIFYYLPIIVALMIYIWNYKQSSHVEKARANLLLFIGYSSFLVLMIFALILYPVSKFFIESLMCKFALVLAIIISYFAISYKN